MKKDNNISIDLWSSKWFGIWREYGDSYKNYPSVNEFIFPEIVKKYELKKLLNYLRNCQVISATSREHFPDPVTGEIIYGSICYRTDGKWLWLDDLPDYIEKHSVAIPKEFLKNIEDNGYIPLEWSGDFKNLDWPT